MHIERSERNYILFTAALLVVFAAALAIGGVANGIRVPAPELVVDPRTVATPGVSAFGDPVEERVREIAPGKYEAYILAQAWKFEPGAVGQGGDPITVPAGSTVTFYVTSKDIQHGFKLDNTNISFMVLPGQVSKLTATFDEPGEYNFVCYEYCGSAHHIMYGQLVVEDTDAASR